VDKVDKDSKEKQMISKELKDIQRDLEKLVVRLSNAEAMNEASYLRKAVAEIKRATRTL